MPSAIMAELPVMAPTANMLEATTIFAIAAT
jgi:hypothetical protein